MKHPLLVMNKGKLLFVARELFQQHGLTEQGWTFGFRNYAHRLGWSASSGVEA
jgi:hypothetical protein